MAKPRRAKTPAERNRARDIKRALAKHQAGKGPPLTREAAAWLRDYKASIGRSPIVQRTPEPEPEPAKPPPPKPKPKAAPPPPEPDDDDEDDEDDDEDDDDDGESGEHERPPADEPPRKRRLSFEDDAPAPNGGGGDAHATTGCRIENCPECKSVAGSQVCGTTGKRVWDPIDDESADAIGEFVLGAVGLLAGGVGWLVRGRKDPFVVVKPNERDEKKMSKAARKFSHRRANWIGEWEDIVLGVPTTVSYGRRAFVGESPKERKQREDARRAWLDEDDDDKPKEKPDAAAAE